MFSLRRVMVASAELCLYVSIFLECVVPPYVHPSISGIPLTVRTATLILLPLGIVIKLFTVRNWSLHRHTGAMFLVSMFTFSWALVVISAAGQTYAPSFTMTTLLRNELSLSWLCLILCALCNTGADFVRRLSICVLIITLVVLTVNVIELVIGVNPMLSAANSSGESYLPPSALRNESYRAFSTFSHPLLLAQFYSSSLCFTLYLITTATKVKKVILAFVASTVFVLSFSTSTRSSLVEDLIAVGVFVIAYIIAKSVKYFGPAKTMVTVAFTLVYALAVVPFLSSLFNNLIFGQSADEVSSSLARASMLREGLSHVFDHLTGFGYGMSIPTAGLLVDGRMSIDNYFLFTGLNSGALSAFLMITSSIFLVAISLSPYLISQGSPSQSSLSSSLALVWVFNCIIHANTSLHFFFFCAIGMAVGRALHLPRAQSVTLPDITARDLAS